MSNLFDEFSEADHELWAKTSPLVDKVLQLLADQGLAPLENELALLRVVATSIGVSAGGNGHIERIPELMGPIAHTIEMLARDAAHRVADTIETRRTEMKLLRTTAAKKRPQ